MPSFFKYSLYIFDCDGVIFNSNYLKLEAMDNALKSIDITMEKRKLCIENFSQNFGKSRYHHVEQFKHLIFSDVSCAPDSFSKNVLDLYSKQCLALYKTAELEEGIVDLLSQVSGPCYVASGSDEIELKAVFRARQLDRYFVNIYGSPKPKKEIIASILAEAAIDPSTVIMVGDAESDCIAASFNKVDFLYYSPRSMVASKMQDLQIEFGFAACDSFNDLIAHK